LKPLLLQILEKEQRVLEWVSENSAVDLFVSARMILKQSCMKHRISPEVTGELQLGSGSTCTMAPFRSRIIATFHRVLINSLIYFVSRVSFEDKHPYISYFRRVWFPCWSILMIFDLGDKPAGDERIQDGRLHVTFQ